jgi:hypothetical protein
MPRFFMHFVGQDGETTDLEGFDAADETAARRTAMIAAGQIITDELAAGHATIAFTLCLDDADMVRIGALPVAASVAAFPSPRFSRPAV